jgi:protein-tyrosine phosphatase
MDEIQPGLWIGNVGSITKLKQLYVDDDTDTEPRYTHWTVITLLNNAQLVQFVRNAIASYRQTNDDSNNNTYIADHVEWKLSDTPHANFLSIDLLPILESIRKALIPTFSKKKACLVHCAQGVSRSAAVIAAFLMYTQECVKMEDALHKIRLVRPSIQPNIGFIAGLRAIEQCHGNIEAAIDRMKQRERDEDNQMKRSSTNCS